MYNIFLNKVKSYKYKKYIFSELYNLIFILRTIISLKCGSLYLIVKLV